MALPQGFVNRDNRLIRQRNQLARKIGDVLEHIGFEEGYVSLLYPLKESFPKDVLDDRMKFLDTSGNVMCVTDDTVTGLLQSTDGKLCRLYGMAEQYRLFGERRNEACFAAVIGGLSGVEPEAEIIATAVRIMEKLSIPIGKIVLGSSAVIRGAAESILNKGVTRVEIDDLLAGKTSTEEEASAAAVLREIYEATGGISVIGDVAQKITNKASVDALVSLFELSKVLDEYGLTDKVLFDMSYFGGDYVHGDAFAVYDDKDNKIIDGGRHDYLNGEGIMRAVSLRIYPDYVLSLYPELSAEEKGFDVVVGIANGINAVRHAYSLKNKFADEGLKTTVLYNVTREDTLAYASAFNIECPVYVDGDGKIIYE